MNRRALLKSLIPAAFLPWVPSVTGPRRKLGCLTIEGHRHHLKSTGENLEVYLDGIKLHGVYEADDIEGYVLAFCTDEQEHRNWSVDGRAHLMKGKNAACQWHLKGNVEFRVKRDA